MTYNARLPACPPIDATVENTAPPVSPPPSEFGSGEGEGWDNSTLIAVHPIISQFKVTKI